MTTDDRAVYSVRFHPMAAWYCVPVDMTLAEKVEFLGRLRDETFTKGMYPEGMLCPLTYIAQRCYGGFECEHGNRRHVVHVMAEYSMMAADQGDYYPRTSYERSRTWNELISRLADKPWGGGPFLEDAPEDVSEGE